MEHLVAQKQYFEEVLLLILKDSLPGVNLLLVQKQHISYSLGHFRLGFLGNIF